MKNFVNEMIGMLMNQDFVVLVKIKLNFVVDVIKMDVSNVNELFHMEKNKHIYLIQQQVEMNQSVLCLIVLKHLMKIHSIAFDVTLQAILRYTVKMKEFVQAIVLR